MNKEERKSLHDQIEKAVVIVEEKGEGLSLYDIRLLLVGLTWAIVAILEEEDNE